MIESFLKEGNQQVDAKNPSHIDLNGLSITDPCLGWEHTEETLFRLAEQRSNNKYDVPPLINSDYPSIYAETISDEQLNKTYSRKSVPEKEFNLLQ